MSSLQHFRIGALATTCALLILGSLAARSADVVTAAQPVTARPPLVAVPAPPMTKALQTRMHQCTAAAHAKQLHGKERDAYMRSCAAAKHAPSVPPQQTAKAAAATPR